MKKTFMVQAENTLLPFLLASLSELSRNNVKSLLTRRQVQVDGQAAWRHDHPLAAGQTVEIRSQGLPIIPGQSGKRLVVLYEDEWLVAVNKPDGLLSMASEKEKERTAYRLATDYVRGGDPHSRNRVFIVHRLDRDTSGVLLLAKSEEVKRALQDNWQTAARRRGYQAVVRGRPEPADGEITSWLRETTAHRVYSSNRPGDGLRATTRYQTLKTGAHCTLVALTLTSGRKHQIRVQLKDIGHPVMGDKLYGDGGGPRLFLHAHLLELAHPMTGQTLRLEAPTPPVFFSWLGKGKPREQVD